jgi:hypothetical protein
MAYCSTSGDTENIDEHSTRDANPRRYSRR